jgi:hypothetical protein
VLPCLFSRRKLTEKNFNMQDVGILYFESIVVLDSSIDISRIHFDRILSCFVVYSVILHRNVSTLLGIRLIFTFFYNFDVVGEKTVSRVCFIYCFSFVDFTN